MNGRRRARRVADWLLAAALLAVTALIVARLDQVSTRTFGGRAVVIDGDSLEIGALRVRLKGIDAPELAQTCGREGEDYACGRQARDALKAMVAPGVSCSGSERDRYDRFLARCTADGRDINRAMVSSGWAVAFGAYEAEEDMAREDRAGLWAGDFQMPRDWRTQRGSATELDHNWLSTLANWAMQIAGWRPAAGE